MATELRPMSLGELLDHTFTHYRQHFWTLVGIMTIPEAVLVVARSLLLMRGEANFSTTTAQPSAAVQAQLAKVLAGFFVGFGVTLVLYILVYSIALGAVTWAVSEFYLGRTITIRECYRRLRGKVGRIIGLGLLAIVVCVCGYLAFIFAILLPVGIAGGLGTVLASSKGGLVAAVALWVAAVVGAVVGGLWILRAVLRYCGVAVPAMLVEDIGPVRAMGRSWRLAKGRTGPILWIVILTTLIRLVFVLVFQAPFWLASSLTGSKLGIMPLSLSLPMTISGGIAGAIGGPLIMIGLVLLYYDARVRTEAFDLQLMMASLDSDSKLPLVPPDHALEAGPETLRRTSVPAMILLYLVSLGLYAPLWFLRRREALNRLRSQEKVGSTIFIAVILLLAVSIVLGVAGQSMGGEAASLAEILSRAMGLAAGIAMIVQAFKVRRILEDHINLALTTASPFSIQENLNGVAVFLLGILYRQYKINQFLDIINRATQPVPAASQVPAAQSVPRAVS